MQITAGGSTTITLPIGQYLALTCPAGSVGSVTRLPDQPGGVVVADVTPIAGVDIRYGPFTVAARFLVKVTKGLVTATNTDVPAAGPKITYITSSPTSPGPDVDMTSDIVYLTSSGSAGTEYINIPGPDWPPSPDQIALAGHHVKISTIGLTDPADSPRILLDGSGSFPAVIAQSFSFSNPGFAVAGVVMDYEGALTVFQSVGDWVIWRRDLGDWNDNTPYAEYRLDIHSMDSNTDGQYAGSLIMSSGTARVGNANGGVIYLQCGDGHGTGHGGHLNLMGGTAGADNADGGNVSISPGAKSGSGVDGELVLNLRNFTNATGVVTMTNGPAGISGNPDRWMKVNMGGFHAAMPIWFVQGQ